MWQSMFNLAPGSKQQTKQSAAPAVSPGSIKDSAKDNALKPLPTDTLPAATAKAQATVRFDDDWSSRY